LLEWLIYEQGSENMVMVLLIYMAKYDRFGIERVGIWFDPCIYQVWEFSGFDASEMLCDIYIWWTIYNVF